MQILYKVGLWDSYAEFTACMEDVVLPSYSAVINSSTAACDYKEATQTTTVVPEDALKAIVESITDESVMDVSQLE